MEITFSNADRKKAKIHLRTSDMVVLAHRSYVETFNSVVAGDILQWSNSCYDYNNAGNHAYLRRYDECAYAPND